jgi:glycerol-3-phosphate cytidylyltransferase-like family protein
MKQKRETPIMSEETRRAILEHARNVEKNTPRIRKILAKRGKKADPVLVFITAQYYDCLNRLAKE